MSFTEILEELPKLKEEERHLLSERLKELDESLLPMTMEKLAKIWKPGATLSPEEADAFERDIEEGRKIYKPYVSPWES